MTKDNYQLLLDSLQDKSFNEVESLPFFQRANEIAAQKRFFHWEMEFPDIFFDRYGRWLDDPGFDGIVGNPPYGMLQPHNTEINFLEYLRLNFTASGFKVDMFNLFVEQSIINLTEDGLLGMIIPNTFIMNVYSKKLRDFLTVHAKINKLVVSEEKLFKEADVHNAIAIFRKEKEIKLREENLIEIIRNVDENFLKGDLNNSIAIVENLLQKDLCYTSDNSWSIRLTFENIKIINKIKLSSNVLKNFATINRGLITGNRKKYFSKIKKDDNWFPIITGKNVLRYEIIPPNEYVLFEKPKTAGGCWDKHVHFNPSKIVIRQIGSYPIATLDENKYCVTGNIFTVINISHLSNNFLLGIINSNLIRFIWTILFQDFKTSFTELKGEHLEQIPIKNILVSESWKNEQKYSENTIQLQNNIFSEYDKKLTNFNNLKIEEDQIHDFLSIIVEQIMKLSQQKIIEINNFKNWLNLTIGIDKNILYQSIFNEYYSFSPDKFFNELDKKKIFLNSQKTNEVKMAFEQSVSKINSFIFQIQKTDWLIDQFVYRLYGLTEEEIRIVEESLKVKSYFKIN